MGNLGREIIENEKAMEAVNDAADRHIMATWKETTEERYWDMLGCVPPVAQRGFGFLVGEAADHGKCKLTGNFAPRYDAFVEIGGRFFESTGPMTIWEWSAVKPSDVAA